MQPQASACPGTDEDTCVTKALPYCTGLDKRQQGLLSGNSCYFHLKADNRKQLRPLRKRFFVILSEARDLDSSVASLP